LTGAATLIIVLGVIFIGYGVIIPDRGPTIDFAPDFETGVLFIIVGILVLFAHRIPLLRNHPGDFPARGGTSSIYWIALRILVSTALAIILILMFGR